MNTYKTAREIERDFAARRTQGASTLSACREVWGYLVETGIATDDELNLVSNINGFTLETMESVIYVRTGYRSLEQLREEEN